MAAPQQCLLFSRASALLPTSARPLQGAKQIAPGRTRSHQRMVECWWSAGGMLGRTAALIVTRSPRIPTNLMVESRGNAEARSQANSPQVAPSAGGMLWECWLWVPHRPRSQHLMLECWARPPGRCNARRRPNALSTLARMGGIAGYDLVTCQWQWSSRGHAMVPMFRASHLAQMSFQTA